MKAIISKGIDGTVGIGAKLGRLLKGGDVVALVGELGSGKTTLVKGIAEGLGVKDSRYVNSPSFVIIKEYRGNLPLYHFDIYRLDSPSDMETVGYREYFYADGVSVIEWADKIKELLPDEYLNIELSIKGKSEREIKIIPKGTRYDDLLRRLKL
ncbi:MAG: tRNA (adenosine(37)-N6)-threonylcarbamoyltransferase complex ATPase subunit type 1 TsaE [Candidatus Omnitrophica bacterium]|nr:tRNA (adenosine(37)-N6)-threonylcarbamoyltransferase complex ATPase subunit type 1 TsaE [Candidatus Omnitrophota bacterium]